MSNKVMSGEEYDKYLEKQAQKYIQNPKTKVYISYNCELGSWRYSVVVANSDDFWLDSFETNDEAEQFIRDNHLKIIEGDINYVYHRKF